MSRRHRRQRLVRRLTILALTIVLALAVVLLFRQGLPFYTKRYVERTSRLMGWPTHIGSLRTSPWFVEAREVTARHGPYSIEVQSIGCDFFPWELGRPHLRSLAVHGWQISLPGPGQVAATPTAADSGLNWADRWPSFLPPLETIRLTGGEVLWGTPPESLRLSVEASAVLGDSFTEAVLQAGAEHPGLQVGVLAQGWPSTGAWRWQGTAGLERPLFLTPFVKDTALEKILHKYRLKAGPLHASLLAEGSGSRLVSGAGELSWTALSCAQDGFTAGLDSLEAWWKQPAGAPMEWAATVRGFHLTHPQFLLEPGGFSLRQTSGHWSLRTGDWAFRLPGRQIEGLLTATAEAEGTLFDRWQAAGRICVPELTWLGQPVGIEAVDWRVRPAQAEFTLPRLDCGRWPGWAVRNLQTRLDRDGSAWQVIAQTEIEAPFGMTAPLPIAARLEGIWPAAGDWSAEVFLSNRDPAIVGRLAGCQVQGQGGLSVVARASPAQAGLEAEWALTDTIVTRVEMAPVGGESVISASQWEGQVRSSLKPLEEWLGLPQTFGAGGSSPQDWWRLLPAWLSSAGTVCTNLRWPEGEASQVLFHLAQLPPDPTGQQVLSGGLQIEELHSKYLTINPLAAFFDLTAESVAGEVRATWPDGPVTVRTAFSWCGPDRWDFEAAAGPALLYDAAWPVWAGSPLPAGHLSGLFEFSAWLASGGAELMSEGELSLGSGRIEIPQWELTVEGLRFDTRWRSLRPPLSDGPQPVYFQTLTAGKIVLSKGVFVFELTGPQTILVRQAQWDWEGARLMAAPFTIDLAKRSATLAVACVGIDLHKLTAFFPDLHLEAAGLVDGVLAAKWEGDRVRPQPGYLELRAGETAHVRYRQKGWLGSLGGEIQTGLKDRLMSNINRAIENAFQDLTVSTIRLDFFSDPAAPPLVVTLAGSGHDPEIVNGDVPIGSLRLNIRFDLEELLRANLPFLRNGSGWKFETGPP